MTAALWFVAGVAVGAAAYPAGCVLGWLLHRRTLVPSD